jgi:pyruvate ferredoxin oxidoreductase beta subunit
MNTGIQRSGATPFGANTTTSPAGVAALGKAQQRKDMTAIAVAHHIPYVAQAVSTHWQDLSEKVERAAHAEGPAFLNVLTNCPVGWGHEPRRAPEILNAAVNSCYWPLYEVVEGRYRLTYVPEAVVPVEEWLQPQKRFAHLFTDEGVPVLREIQRRVDEEWAALRARCES